MNKIISYLALVGVILGSFSLGYIMNEQETLIVYNNTVKIVETEKPVIITETVTSIETIEIPYPVLINNTKLIYVDRDPGAFQNRSEFITWLWNDKTDELTYSDRWTCFDFTMRIFYAGLEDGYLIVPNTYWSKTDTTHDLARAYIIDEAKWVIFEPQSDKIWWEWDSTIGG